MSQPASKMQPNLSFHPHNHRIPPFFISPSSSKFHRGNNFLHRKFYTTQHFNRFTFNMAPLDTSQPLTQFTLFPTLPVELRLAIYNTHNTPRIIFIDHQPHYKSKAVLFRNRSVPSTLLQVCRESRLFTLQTHTLAFLHHCKGADFYFDFKHDALCFQSVYIMKQFFNLPTRTGDGSPRVPFSVERRLRTIICGEGMGQMMDQLDFYALGRPELVISVRQEEAGNVYQASPEVSWDYQHPEPEDMEGTHTIILTFCSL